MSLRLSLSPNGLREAKARSRQGNRGVVAARPQELLEIHRTHSRAFLLTGDEDVPGVPAYRDERTGLDVVVAAVLDELFDGLPRPRTHLDLVEYDQRLPVEQPGRIPQLELEEQVVEVGHVVEQFAASRDASAKSTSM